MSVQNIPYRSREGSGESGPARFPASVLGAMAGFGFLLLLPGAAKADSYGHAEVTLGFPNGQVTMGRTWDEHPRRVVVEEVTHKYPSEDADDDPEYDGDRHDDYDEDEPDQVIIEKRVHRPHVKKVTIIERYEEPVHCDRHVVREVYVERPSCRRPEVVVYRSEPQRVIYAPSRTVIVAQGRAGWGHGHGYGHSHGGYQGERYQVDDRGPRDLFPEAGGRAPRTRGVQQHLVQVGGHHH